MGSMIVEYIDAAVRTEKVPQFEIFIEGKVPGGHLMQTSSAAGITGELKVRLLHSALGMMTEIRELQEALEKRDWVNVGEEVGDVLWYWAVAMRALRIEHVAQVPPTKTWVRAETRTGRPLIEAICAWGDLVRRDAIHAKGMKPEDAAAALGEIWGQVYVLCTACELDVGDVMRRNIAKLRVRFPEKYDGVRFDQRDLEAERAVLESGPCPAHDGLDKMRGLHEVNRRANEFMHRLREGKKCTCAKDIPEGARCTCIGLPPAPGGTEKCPVHPER